MLEGDLDRRESSEALQQDPLEVGLVEGAERRMAVEAAGEVGRHQGDVARIQVAHVRILNETRRDLVEEAHLAEETQRLRIIGDRPRQAEQPGVSLENQHANPGEAEQIRRHQPDRAGADNCDLDRERPAAVPRCILWRHGDPPTANFSVALIGQFD